MRFSQHRTLRVCMTAGALALAAGSTAVAVAPAAQAAKKATPCTQGQTFKITGNTPAKTRSAVSDGVNIRKLPGTDCPKVATVKKGTKLPGTGRNAVLIPNGKSKWTEITYGGVKVWVANTQIK